MYDWKRTRDAGDCLNSRQKDSLPLVAIELDSGATIRAGLYPHLTLNTINLWYS